MKTQTIGDLQKKYFQKLDPLDLELLIAHILKKTREFVLAHPEYKLIRNQKLRIKNYVQRRMNHEPLAYIVGHKEFFGLNFAINKHTLIPRPETEQLVELTIQESRIINKELKIIDVGTGSGCIIVSIAAQLKNQESRIKNYNLYATDISNKALEIAKRNAATHNVDKKIKFLRGNLLNPFIQNSKLKIKNSTILIVANLPYLSKEIYSATSNDVKNFEPKSALYSSREGLAHYEKLFKQIKSIAANHKLRTTSYIEISPEQKPLLKKTIPKYFPDAKIKFDKDLSGLWRICKIDIKSAN